MQACYHNQIVKKAVDFVGGGRSGTAVCKTDRLREIFGEPNVVPCDKVTIGWTFVTPRGPVEIRDYWWNVPDAEWSIGAPNIKAARWAAGLLRSYGIPASTRFHGIADVKGF